MPPRTAALVLTLALPLVGCAEAPSWPLGAPAPVASPAAPTRADAVTAARRCGATLGYAARCNLLRDDRDFTTLRFAVLQGLRQRYGDAAAVAEIEETVDLATLGRMTSVASCAIPPGDAARVEAGFRAVVAECTGP